MTAERSLRNIAKRALKMQAQCWICPKCHDDHSPKGKCKTIDQWEVEARTKDISFDHKLKEFTEISADRKRILALIDLIRMKDKVLISLIDSADRNHEFKTVTVGASFLKELVQLTEKLK